MRVFGLLPTCLGLAAMTGLGACRLTDETSHLPPAVLNGSLPPELNEASGLAFSRREEGLLWLNNDSGDLPKLLAIDLQGQLLGSALVDGESPVDWEDCASFTLDGKAWLMAADVGDNNAERRELKLVFIPEPDRRSLSRERPLVTKPAWVTRFIFPDGAVDCESATVDAPNRRVLLISKRTKPPCLYSVPLFPSGEQPVVAQRLESLDWIRKPAPLKRLIANPRNRYSEQPTGLSLSSDGRHAALLSYTCVWYFVRKDTESWEQCLASPGLRIPVDRLEQAEAVGLSADGRTLIVTGENQGTQLLRWTLPSQD